MLLYGSKRLPFGPISEVDGFHAKEQSSLRLTQRREVIHGLFALCAFLAAWRETSLAPLREDFLNALVKFRQIYFHILRKVNCRGQVFKVFLIIYNSQRIKFDNRKFFWYGSP